MSISTAIILAVPKRPAFAIIFAEGVEDHLRFIERKYHSVILETIADQLAFEPEVETRNRKPLSEPSTFGVAWEIRFGDPGNRFRVFYRVDRDLRQARILAIMVKRNNRLYIGNQEFEL